ncbi:MAG: tRNA lysidine(34) synthetase TilS, partial [Clostridia bacterium]|nr:tRNA lysidine(34) synthetase TilS [Clostridia bacterium]
EIAQSENRYLDELASKCVEINGDEVYVKTDVDDVILSRALVIAMKSIGIEKDYEKAHIDGLLSIKNNLSGKKINLLNGIVGVNDYGRITLYKETQKCTDEVNFTIGKIAFGNKTLTVGKTVTGCAQRILKFDFSKIPATAVLRTRRDGDIFKPYGSGSKKLKEYLIDKKIPSRKRDDLVLLADGSEILIIFGIEISDNIKIDERSTEILQCGIKNN